MKKRPLSEKQFETRLARLLERRLENCGGSVTTFQDAGVLTMNRGLVVSLPGRGEFQITIVQSRRSY
jgi:hypothetical protein